MSATYKNLPGIPVTANYVLTTAQLAPILGRTSTAAGSATQATIPGQGTVSATVFDQRLNETDLQLSKNLRVNRGRVRLIVNVYNVFNARTPQTINTTYGASFMVPSALLGGRLWKFGAEVNW